MEYRYRPVRDNIVIRMKAGEEISAGGIVLAHEGSRESMVKEEGEIIEVGADCFGDTPESRREKLRPGMIVFIPRYAGRVITKDRTSEIRVIKDLDVLVIKEPIENKEVTNV